ncbi:RNA 2',3'-cyclic phosphodiesterase [Sphingomonas sp.]|uniref:RNA 2',3'-cyclic phosphodiesterase n=1 Tax=Sphingomonas sp. TaxID=28214 RepID=UPI00286E2149|nr:RNA 2',3'-cyclic phosphodiesterase [Sphingomonas sp.]
MHRLFAAIRPPEAIRDQLIDAMDDGPELKWVGDEQVHLTLRFIGEVERPLAEDIAAALARVRAERFALSIAGIGRFDRRGGGALWAGIVPKPPVAALAAKIERACLAAGLAPEHRAFHPHITLARWTRASAHAADAFAQRTRALASEPWPVEAFTLFESHLSRHGAHYEAVADYPLV